jgi:predicted acetyltransferase
VSATPIAENAPVRGARLIEPDTRMAQAYRRFLQEFIDAGEEGMLLHLPDEEEAPEDCVRRLLDHAAGLNLPDGWVPCSTFWLLSDEEVLLGEIRIRHQLTPALEDYGGHIGYMVRPGLRGKGHATRMLALALEKARVLKLRQVLVTCDRGNAASARVILKNGGKLAGESDEKAGRVTSRYWIGL